MWLMASSPAKLITEADTVAPVRPCRMVSVFGVSSIEVNRHAIPVTRVASPASE